jgi:hypothetical protein
LTVVNIMYLVLNSTREWAGSMDQAVAAGVVVDGDVAEVVIACL